MIIKIAPFLTSLAIVGVVEESKGAGEMQFYVKVYRMQNEIVVAVCDENLRGRCFEEGELVLDVKKEFYGGELKGEKEAAELLKSATIANIVGENAVALAAKIGVIDSSVVLRVKGVPHAQMVQM